MPYKDKVRQREYQRKWYKRKRVGKPTQLVRLNIIAPVKHPKTSYEQKRKLSNKRTKKWHEKLKQKRDETWGTKCLLCGHQKRLLLHEKHGNKHPTYISYLAKALQKPEQFVRLCSKCHTGVHFCMSVLGMTWEDVEKRWRERRP